jgi:hypothetical protein
MTDVVAAEASGPPTIYVVELLPALLRDTGAMTMTKQQKLKNTAEGLLAGLVAVGYEGPWRWAHHQWEGAFYRAWRAWPPSSNTDVFRTFQVGGSANGRTSQGRDILFAVNRNSPFDGYNQRPLNPTPRGQAPVEYLADSVEGASPQQWMDLARAFLVEMDEPLPDPR